MNILLIGNGFDIAHGLKTKYTDFLEFIEPIVDLKYNFSSSDELDILRNLFINKYDDQQYYKQISCNIWINEFLELKKTNQLINVNWVDFEREIGSICKKLDVSDYRVPFKQYDLLKNTFISHVNESNLKFNGNSAKTFEQFVTILENELNNFIRAFSNYLKVCVESADIKNIIPEIAELDIDKVVTFNYTHTFQKLYDRKYIIKYDYLHGEVKYDDTENMILGIESTDTDKSSAFSCFQKYHQRLLKENVCNYVDWLNDLKHTDEENLLYIYGHSLDISDKDVLINFLDNDNFKTITIFYHDKFSKKSCIKNLTDIITAEKLRLKVYGKRNQIQFRNVKKIEFKLEDEIEHSHIKSCIYFLDNFYLLSDEIIKKINDYVVEKIKIENAKFIETQENLLNVIIALHKYRTYEGKSDLSELKNNILSLAKKCVSEKEYQTYTKQWDEYNEDDYIAGIITEFIEINRKAIIDEPEKLTSMPLDNSFFDEIANDIYKEEIGTLFEESRQEEFIYNSNIQIIDLIRDNEIDIRELQDVECSETEKCKLKYLAKLAEV